MTDQEQKSEEKKEQKGDPIMLMALKTARLTTGQNKQKFFFASELKEMKEAPIAPSAPKPYTPHPIVAVPTIDELGKLDQNFRWDGRDLLYEACLISLVDKVLKEMKEQRVSNNLLSDLENLHEALKDGDSKEVVNRLHTLAENWGASEGLETQQFHLLRSIIRIIYATYPL